MIKRNQLKRDLAGPLALACLACLDLGPTVVAQPFPGSVDAVGLPGATAGDNFGKSVAGGSDINGDGFADVVVGAPYADSSASAKGSAFVYLGGPVFFDATPDAVLNGLAADDNFGISVAAGMDLNDDGYGDIAVGARLSDLGPADGGAVFVYFGAPGFPGTPLHLVAEAANDWFGQSVRSAGDVNGDGFDDLIVGAPYNDANGSAAGRTYVYFGGNPMDSTPDVILQGATQVNSHFGWSVSGAGDVNHDGFADVIVGSRLYGNGPSQARGRAYVFLGGNPMNNVADVIMDGENANDWFGESVAGAGDINGDGFADVLVGAIYADPPSGSAAGKAYIYLGGNPMNNVADLTFAGPEADAQLGNALACAGDVNADGFADVAIGAHFADAPSGLNAGQVFVLFGSQAPNNVADVVLSGAAADDQFGESVAAAGAVANPTAAKAFLAGAHYNDTNGNGAGKAYVFRMHVTAPCPADITGDGQVNINDLLAVINAWGPCPAPPTTCPSDITGDGQVNVNDLLAVINAWGPCP